MVINHADGPVIPLAYNNGEPLADVNCTSGLPCELKYAPNDQVILDPDFSKHGIQMADLDSGHTARFPTDAMVAGKALRSIKSHTDALVELPSFEWVPVSTERRSRSADATIGDIPIVDRPGPAFIYQRPPPRPARRAAATLQIIRDGLGHVMPMVFQFQRDNQDQPENIREHIRRTQGATSQERFFPIQGPGVLQTVAIGRDIAPHHVQGIWVASYGAHGTELGYVNVREDVGIVVHRADEGLSFLTASSD